MSNTRKLFESFQKSLNEGAEEDNFIKQCEESGQFDEYQIRQIKSRF